MIENEKRIVLRVDAEKWQALDDKRHSERTTFQKLGIRLFENWLYSEEKSGSENIKITTLCDKMHDTDPNPVDVASESERPWIDLLVNILQGENDIAIRALKSNLVAFSSYIKAVPEAHDDLAVLAADEVRAAGVKQQLVDARKKAAMGADPAAAKDRRPVSKTAVRKRI